MSYTQDTSIFNNNQIKFSFNITKEEFDIMSSFSEDGKVRFLYIITYYKEDGTFNLIYVGKKTASTLGQAMSYYGSSTDSAFLEKSIKSNRSQYKFIVVGYCRNKNELEQGENAFIRFIKDFFKDKCVNKSCGRATFSTEGLISICKENYSSKFVRKQELEFYLNDGWSIGGNSKGLIAIYKGNLNKFVKDVDLNGYLNDGWERGTTQKNLIFLKKDNITIRVKEEDIESYLNDGWLRVGTTKGLISINKGNRVKYVQKEDLDFYYKDGWIKGGKKGFIFMSKDGNITKVDLGMISKYEEDGWVKGNIYKIGLIRIEKDNIEKRVKKEVLSEYLLNGWVLLQKKAKEKIVKEKIIKEKIVKEKIVKEKIVKEKVKYVPYIRTEEHKEKMSLRLKKSVADGVKVSWNKGKHLTEEDKLKKRIAANRPEVKEKRKKIGTGRSWYNNGKDEIWVKEEAFNSLSDKEFWVSGRLPLSNEEKDKRSRLDKYICPYCLKYVSSGNHVGDHITKEHPLEIQWKDLDKKEKGDKYRAINHLELDIVKTYFEKKNEEKSLGMCKVLEDKSDIVINTFYCKKRQMNSLF